jgi:hypothetical protein
MGPLRRSAATASKSVLSPGPPDDGAEVGVVHRGDASMAAASTDTTYARECLVGLRKRTQTVAPRANDRTTAICNSGPGQPDERRAHAPRSARSVALDLVHAETTCGPCRSIARFGATQAMSDVVGCEGTRDWGPTVNAAAWMPVRHGRVPARRSGV